MVANMISRAAVLLAATASIVSAQGSAIIQNQCSFPVYLWSVSNVAGPMQELAPNGGEYSEVYQNNPNGGGVSIKIASSEAAPNVTQFEYTLEGADLWYDLSNINGYPFENWGVSVVPSDSKCNQVICPAGVTLCAAAYNIPTDDFATAECPSSGDMVVVLCSGAQDTTPLSSIVSVSSSIAASTVAASTTPKASSTSVLATSTTVKSTSIFSSSTSSITTTTPTTLATSTTNNNGVVVQTTFVTEVVTVVAGESTTTTASRHHTWTGRPAFTGAVKARRHMHHQHGHQF